MLSKMQFNCKINLGCHTSISSQSDVLPPACGYRWGNNSVLIERGKVRLTLCDNRHVNENMASCQNEHQSFRKRICDY